MKPYLGKVGGDNLGESTIVLNLTYLNQLPLNNRCVQISMNLSAMLQYTMSKTIRGHIISLPTVHKRVRYCTIRLLAYQVGGPARDIIQDKHLTIPKLTP